MKKIILVSIIASFFFPFLANAQGCLGGDSDEGVKVVGYIQGQYEYQFLGKEGKPFNGLNSNNSFYFNRARIGAVGNIPYDFSYYFMMEMSPKLGGPKILDAFITYKRWDPYLNISLGQFKSPFGLELSTPCQALHTVNRSEVVNQLASPFRDFGLLFFGSTGELFGMQDLISYHFAITNGTGMNVMDDNKYKDYTGRLVVTPWEGLSFGGSYRYGKQKAEVDEGEKQDSRRRWGADISFNKYNVLFQAEYIDGYDLGSSEEGGGCGKSILLEDVDEFKKNGYMAMLGYMTPWSIQPIVKFESYDPDADVNYNKQQDWTFGFNYWFNEWTRVQVNYVYRSEESGSTTETYNEIDNDFLVFQLQVIF